MLAVVYVRDGVLPSGGDETIAECGGRVILCGSGTASAASGPVADLGAIDVRFLETGAYAPGALADSLAPHIDDEAVVLPASADGRDLAPRLAQRLGRRLLAGAVHVTAGGASLARSGGLEIEDVAVHEAFVATLIPGVRGAEPAPTGVAARPLTAAGREAADMADVADVEVLAVLPPDVTTMDLAEAPRIVGGGAGLDGEGRFAQLASIAARLGASMGATRVVTDRGWLPHARQIGTTGVVVDPRLYVAFGISGAVQHTSGLGNPEHVVSVNTDPHCPMMQMADLAIVSDANAVLDELAALVKNLEGGHG